MSGPLGEDERKQLLRSSALLAKYEKTVDRESAYEKLKQHVQEKQAPAAPKTTTTSTSNPISDILLGKTGPRGGRQSQGVLEAATKSAARAIGSELGRQIMRGRPRVDPRRRPPPLTEGTRASLSQASYRAWGIVFALVGVLAFSFRPILIKLSYGAHPVSPVTLLFLRMTLSLPFFLAIGWWLRNQQPRLTPRDWAAVAGLGFLGYYAASFLDFIGLQWIGAGVGRLILLSLPHAGAAAFIPLPEENARPGAKWSRSS